MIGFWQQLGDVSLDALLDTLKAAPFLLAALLIIEFIEGRASKGFVNAMRGAGRFGPLLGGALGCIPQCGFSAAVAHLYNCGLITAGTLAATFISTSDEAIPVLIANPGSSGMIFGLLLIKLAAGIIGGFAIDAIWRKQKNMITGAVKEPKTQHTSYKHIIIDALLHTLRLMAYIFAVTLVLNLIIALVGQDNLSSFLGTSGIPQIFIASVFGFIPNCAASVLLIELCINGALSFAATVAGLCTSAGIGILVLLRGGRGAKEYTAIIGAVYVCSVVTGLILAAFGM